MSKYKIQQIEHKEGKNFKDAVLLDEGGENKSVRINQKFSLFNQLEEGMEIEGEINPSEYKGKTYYWLNDLKKQFIPKASGIQKAMDRKEHSINNFQGRKEDGIKISSTARDATLIVTNFYPEFSERIDKEDKIKAEWLKWRSWLYDRWDENPKSDLPPF